jgi:hypothetical protein
VCEGFATHHQGTAHWCSFNGWHGTCGLIVESHLAVSLCGNSPQPQFELRDETAARHALRSFVKANPTERRGRKVTGLKGSAL